MRAMRAALRSLTARGDAALLVVFLTAAALLRFHALAALPPAHYRDVALTALDALRAAAGHPCLHYTYDEGLYANLMGLLFVVIGPSDWSVRAPGALFGLLTCWAVYRLGLALGLRRAGLYGAGLLAVSFWHVLLSRSGFRAVLLPLLLAGSFALLARGLEERDGRRMAWAGALLGLGLHVYPSVYFAPFILPAYLAAAIGRSREAWRRAFRGLAIFAATAFLVALPMLLDDLHHPEHVTLPHRIISVFSPKLDPATVPAYLRRSVVATALMLHVSGDANWRHNLPGAPMLDPLTGALFLLGCVAVLRVPRARGAATLLFAWLLAMLLPNLLSVEGVPHGLRSCGILPAVALLAGVGLGTLCEALARRVGERSARGLSLAAILVLGLWTGHRYFTVWGRDPQLFAAHDGAYRAASRRLLAAPPGVQLLLIANGGGYKAYGQPAEVMAYLFEMRDRAPVLVGPRDGDRLVLAGRPALVAFVRRDDRILQVIRDLNPGAAVTAVEAPGLSPDSPVYRIE